MNASPRVLARAARTACAAVLLSACMASCASTHRDDGLSRFPRASEGAETFISLESCSNLIPLGRNEVEVVLSVEGRELWRAVVRRERWGYFPEVQSVAVPKDLPDVGEFTFVVRAGDAEYALRGPDPRRQFIVIHAYAPDRGVGLWASDEKPASL